MNQRTLLSTGLWAASLLTVRADERFFTYVYEADVLPAGKWEFEQWLTYRKGFPEGDRNFAQHLWDFREEIEYGVTDHFSSSCYLNFRNDRRVARRPGLED